MQQILRQLQEWIEPKPISFLDVKAKYDDAYALRSEARDSVRQYRQAMAEARRLDVRYRAQLDASGAGALDRRAA